MDKAQCEGSIDARLQRGCQEARGAKQRCQPRCLSSVVQGHSTVSQEEEPQGSEVCVRVCV